MDEMSVTERMIERPLAKSWTVFVKDACETCQLVAPIIAELVRQGHPLRIVVQDDDAFLHEAGAEFDARLEQSFRADIEITPTLIAYDGDLEGERITGWDRAGWRAALDIPQLGEDLPAFRPGCGSRTREPGINEHLVAQFGSPPFAARAVAVGDWDDDVEICFDRGWSDGLPVVPPTDARILRMLGGTVRNPTEVIGKVPPNLAPVTVEKVAINAVMAGCKPEYMPVLLTALEAALEPVFTLHGLLCTTCFSSPIIVVNGPAARQIGMNWGMNVLGQGNRANATIGRALQLIVRNVGGGIPGDLDRSTLGGPGKLSFCFAEDETDPSWTPLSVDRGIAQGRSAVTLFQGDGIQGFIDQRSRTPDQLATSLASALLAVGHPKLCEFTNAMLVLSPEHHGIFRDGGWDRARITHELHARMIRSGADVTQGAHGVGEGIATGRESEQVNKFWPEGLLIVRAGGQAGLYSAICAGWTGGRFRHESQPVTREITR